MNIDLDFWGHTLQTIGHILIAYTAIRVHFRFWKEHKIDDEVFKSMKKEQFIGILGIIFIIAGYIVHII